MHEVSHNTGVKIRPNNSRHGEPTTNTKEGFYVNYMKVDPSTEEQGGSSTQFDPKDYNSVKITKYTDGSYDLTGHQEDGTYDTLRLTNGELSISNNGGSFTSHTKFHGSVPIHLNNGVDANVLSSYGLNFDIHDRSMGSNFHATGVTLNNESDIYFDNAEYVTISRRPGGKLEVMLSKLNDPSKQHNKLFNARYYYGFSVEPGGKNFAEIKKHTLIR